MNALVRGGEPVKYRVISKVLPCLNQDKMLSISNLLDPPHVTAQSLKLNDCEEDDRSSNF